MKMRPRGHPGPGECSRWDEVTFEALEKKCDFFGEEYEREEQGDRRAHVEEESHGREGWKQAKVGCLNVDESLEIDPG